MTQVHVITRVFDSSTKAEKVKKHLIQEKRFPPAVISVHGSADGLDDVAEATVAAYTEKFAEGAAVVMVRATFKPLNAARIARDTMREMGAMDMGDLVEQVDIREATQRTGSIFTDHRLLLTRRGAISRDPNRSTYHMADWPIPLISRRTPRDQYAFRRHRYWASWPIGHLVPHHVRYGKFPFGLLVPGQKYMAKFPFAHIVPGHKHMAGFPFGHIVPGHKYMAKFPFAHIVPGHKHMAGFPFGHLVPGGRRMANWPFPLLINGQEHTNAVIPGQPYQANWPIPLLSKRKPADKFAFPRHARMANWPLPLISKRKPADKFAFPRHARMADKILPLVIRKSEGVETKPGPKGSFSRFFGLKTVIRR